MQDIWVSETHLQYFLLQQVTSDAAAPEQEWSKEEDDPAKGNGKDTGMSEEKPPTDGKVGTPGGQQGTRPKGQAGVVRQ